MQGRGTLTNCDTLAPYIKVHWYINTLKLLKAHAKTCINLLPNLISALVIFCTLKKLPCKLQLQLQTANCNCKLASHAITQPKTKDVCVGGLIMASVKYSCSPWLSTNQKSRNCYIVVNVTPIAQPTG